MLKQNRAEPQRQTVTWRGLHPAAADLFSVISFCCSLSREEALSHIDLEPLSREETLSHIDLEPLGQVLFLFCFVCVLLVRLQDHVSCVAQASLKFAT